MAAMMMCPAHGPVTGQTCDHQPCFEPLRPYIAEPAASQETCPAPNCGMRLPCRLHSARPPDTGHREVVAYLAASDASPWISSQSAEAIQAAVEFPWGSVTVPAEGLTIGRDFADVCGAQIDTFDNVSRTHARITVEDGQLLVEDLDSTNGTTVNGRPTVPRKPQPVADGDVLGFGNRLQATVTARDAVG